MAKAASIRLSIIVLPAGTSCSRITLVTSAAAAVVRVEASAGNSTSEVMPAADRIRIEHLVLENLRVLQRTVQALMRVGIAHRRVPVQENVNYLHDVEGRRILLLLLKHLLLLLGPSCIITIFTCTSHVLISNLLDGFAEAHDQLKYVPECDYASETAAVGGVPYQRERSGLLDYHSFDALVQRQLVVQDDDLRIVGQ